MRDHIASQSSRSSPTSHVSEGEQPPVASSPGEALCAEHCAAGQSKGGKSKKTGGGSEADHAIAAILPGTESALNQVQPCGTLMARRRRNGSLLFFWRATFKGKLLRVEIGLYSETANRAWRVPTSEGTFSLAAAQARAAAIALEHVGSLASGGYAGLQQAKQQLITKASQDEERLRGRTLGAMLESYWSELLRQGKSSAKEVKNALKLHVIANSPLALKPAKQILDDDIAGILAPIYQAGHGRQANKIRSYLHAAYEMAIASRLDGDLPQTMKSFEVRSNPVSATPASSKYNRADKNPLSTVEMRTYWRCIEVLGGVAGCALRLHLLLGSPRITQFVSAKRGEVTDNALVLWDGKGRPGGGKRPHVLPLTESARKDLRSIGATGDHVFSTNNGETPIANTTLTKWAVEAVGASIENFTLKRVRSGVETLLSSQSVPKEHRSRLQSHGVSGVQAKHYDAYEFFWEKFDAMTILHTCLTSAEVPLPKRAPRQSADQSLALRAETNGLDQTIEDAKTAQAQSDAKPVRGGLRLVVSNARKS